jgi:hypothetical protein
MRACDSFSFTMLSPFFDLHRFLCSKNTYLQ